MTLPLRYDLHMHSRHSFDCLMTPQGIVATAKRRGLAGIAVTDHGTIAGAVDARAAAPPDLLVIVGAEIHTAVGDIVCLFLSEEIVGNDPIDVIAQTRAQGGLAFFPHPLRGHPPGVPRTVLDGCAGFEVLNGRAGWFSPEFARTPHTDWQALTTKARLANSDAHLYSEIGGAYNLIEGPPTEDNVRDALLSGRTRPGGARGPSYNFYISQLIRAGKTRDVRVLRGLLRRLWRGTAG